MLSIYTVTNKNITLIDNYENIAELLKEQLPISYEESDEDLLKQLILVEKDEKPTIIGHYETLKDDLILTLTNLITQDRAYHKRVPTESSYRVEEIGGDKETPDCECVESYSDGYLPIDRTQLCKDDPDNDWCLISLPYSAKLNCKICRGKGYKHQIVDGQLV